jgi:hypothetical protein
MLGPFTITSRYPRELDRLLKPVAKLRLLELDT